MEKSSKKGEKPLDVRATNPYYRGAIMNDVVRAPFRPVDPKVRDRIAARRYVMPEKLADDEPGVKTGV